MAKGILNITPQLIEEMLHLDGTCSIEHALAGTDAAGNIQFVVSAPEIPEVEPGRPFPLVNIQVEKINTHLSVEGQEQ